MITIIIMIVVSIIRMIVVSIIRMISDVLLRLLYIEMLTNLLHSLDIVLVVNYSFHFISIQMYDLVFPFPNPMVNFTVFNPVFRITPNLHQNVFTKLMQIIQLQLNSRQFNQSVLKSVIIQTRHFYRTQTIS